MATITHEVSKTKQQLVDQFNEALALLDTSKEEIRFQARISKTFKETPTFSAGITLDIALKHQYQMLTQAISITPDPLVNNKADETFALFSNKLCYGGATLIEIPADAFLSVLAPAMPRAVQKLSELLTNEIILLAENMLVSEITPGDGMQRFAHEIIAIAKEKNVDYLAIVGCLQQTKQLLHSMKGTYTQPVYTEKADDKVLLVYRISKIH